MIPASYLFKDVYRQTWINPEPVAPITEAELARAARGSTWLASLIHRLPHPGRRQAACPNV